MKTVKTIYPRAGSVGGWLGVLVVHLRAPESQVFKICMVALNKIVFYLLKQKDYNSREK